MQSLISYLTICKDVSKCLKEIYSYSILLVPKNLKLRFLDFKYEEAISYSATTSLYHQKTYAIMNFLITTILLFWLP